jgi:lipopolysaccharide biosynthesis glycosyltransferase
MDLKNDTFLIRPIHPPEKTKTFVFYFNETYVKYFSVALLSLIARANPNNTYEIIVLYNQISNEKQSVLQDLLPANFTIRFVCVVAYVEEVLGDLSAKMSSTQWDVSTFYVLLVPLLMPDYERVLCCDSDIIFNKNPDELFDMSFDGKKLIAVTDSIKYAMYGEPVSKFVQEQKLFINHELNIQDLQYYFNVGVILFNIKAIDKENYLEKVLQSLSFPFLPFLDQDALNFIFKDDVKIIPLRFNFQYHLLNSLPSTVILKDIFSEYFAASKEPVIVHYTTPEKPWRNPGYSLGCLFWEYARKSPFYEEIIYENLIEKQEASVLQIKHSLSFRIGRAITFIPRKVRDFMKTIK